MDTNVTVKDQLPADLPDHKLPEFDQKITQLITAAYSEDKQGVAHISLLAEGLTEVSEMAIAIGDLAYRDIEAQNLMRLEDFLISFDWAERVKYFLLLWRDILFEEHKSFLMVSDGDITLQLFEAQKMKSRDLLFEKSNDFKNYLSATKAATPDHQKVLDIWKLQNNPWPVYRRQFEQFEGQAREINNQFVKLWNSSGAYVVINSHFIDTFTGYLDTLNQVKAEILAISDRVKSSEGPIGLSVVNELEEVDRKVLISSRLGKFNSDLNSHIRELPNKMKVNVDTQYGQLRYKDLNIRQSTNEWIESEVMSEVYEFFQISDNIHSRLNLAIENIRNLIENERVEDQPHPTRDILQILQNLNKNLDKSSESIFGLKKHVEVQLAKTLGVSRVFNDEFLALSFQSTINQYRRYQVKWWEKLKSWVQEKGYFIRQYRKSVREEEMMSISEKIVRVIRARSVQAENLHYTNIFMTKGYIGRSFWVGRVEELNHLQQQVDNWKNGYRGAVLLSGKRFSGKTLMGSLVNQNFFANQAIILSPENKITVQGRPFETTMDLGAALDFIFKYNQEKKLIWIDDLELWEDDKITLSENIRRLTAVIDQNAGRVFFMVSCSNWLREQLSKWFEIEKIFQTEISLDRMSMEEIQKAVLIRHSATHMQLVNADGEEFTPQELEKLLIRIYRHAEGNIGEVMHHWAALMHKYNDEKVHPHTDVLYTLPDFINPDIATLLRLIIIEKRTNEYRLRKHLGPAFKTVYRPILQRALNLGLVQRDLNGWLVINSMVVNETGRLLDKNQYIEFDSKKGYPDLTLL